MSDRQLIPGEEMVEEVDISTVADIVSENDDEADSSQRFVRVPPQDFSAATQDVEDDDGLDDAEYSGDECLSDEEVEEGCPEEDDVPLDDEDDEEDDDLENELGDEGVDDDDLEVEEEIDEEDLDPEDTVDDSEEEEIV